MRDLKGKPPIIMVMSDKGGVGKSVIAANLAVALSGYGMKVLLADADMAHPSIGLHFGIEPRRRNVKDFLEGKSPINCTLSRHKPSGIDLMLCDVGEEPFKLGAGMLYSAVSGALKVSKRYDFVVVDMAAMSRIYMMANDLKKDLHKYIDEMIIVAVPEIADVVNTLKVEFGLDIMKINYVVVLNMVSGKEYELKKDIIEKTLGKKVFMELPQDKLIPTSIYRHVPAVLLSPYSKFSIRIRELAAHYIAAYYPKKSVSKIKQLAESEEEYEMKLKEDRFMGRKPVKRKTQHRIL